ncbi:hypothetical protein SAMN04490179_4564 [Pseudomonas antarctica]|uniref:Lipoprotein n=2 Tax=Pseudomonas antarctica TaxID=219572 RepID=A0A1H0BZ18_9PSED|nr:hypothetical protein PSAN_49040 [Pseudomonas antarctica]SDN50931.1 hypothetical protein SAMN04490179_4564 [Pseudomonas antarctica]
MSVRNLPSSRPDVLISRGGCWPMGFIASLGLAGACLAGCSHTPAPTGVTTPDAIESLSQPRIKVAVAAKDAHIAKTKALAGLEGAGWVFDPVYATAVSMAGRDLAVCGFARQRGTENSAYFAYYNGELFISDERAPAGVSVENEFLTLICSYS